MGPSHDLHLHGTKKIRKKIHLCTKRDLNLFSQGSSCRRQYSPCQYLTAYSQKQFPISFERSHSDESTWSNNEQRWSSVWRLALYGANRLVIVVLHLRVNTAMLLLLPASTLLCRNKPQLLTRTLHKETALPLRSTLTTLEQNCANVDSSNGYCFGILTSISFTARCYL